MSLEKARTCPSCGDEQTFWRTAATTLHLGMKTKWTCGECRFGFVEINGISTAPESA